MSDLANIDDEETTWVKFGEMEEMGEDFSQVLIDINNRHRMIRSIKVIRSKGVLGFFQKAVGAVITHTSR